MENVGGCSNWEFSHYAELGSDEELPFNIWLTHIMVAELENYQLETEDVYIPPLGKRVSRENKTAYKKELEFN